jgi:hypothetical protein
MTVHVDGWRDEIAPSYWVTSRVSVHELHGKGRTPRFQGQLRLWSQGEITPERDRQVATLNVSGPVNHTAPDRRGPTPPEEQREWNRDVVRRFADRLVRLGVAAPASQVQSMCTQMAAALIEAGQLPLAPVECVILLRTAPLTVLPVEGHLFVNRTYFDVAPDSAAIATGILHALVHMALSQVANPSLLLGNRDPMDILDDLEASYPRSREGKIDEQVAAIFEKSEHRNSLALAGGLLDMIQHLAPRLPALIGANFAGHADTTQALRRSALMVRRPLDCQAPEAACALAIGSRLLVHPATNKLELHQLVTFPAPGQDKNLFGVTAFFPRIERLGETADH